MSKKIQFAISYPGLCCECEHRPLFSTDAPDGWELMSEEEKKEWARETFFEGMSWVWVEV